MRTVALIPAHNEAVRIADTVRAVRSVPTIGRVLVIDDGSTDSTADAARAAGAEVLVLAANRGKGGALQAGIDRASSEADILLFLDADLGASAAEAAALLAPVLAGQAEMTVAILPKPPGSGGVGLVKGLARAGIRGLSGYTASAPLSGQRALTRKAWTASLPIASGYGVEVALTVCIAYAGLTILEVPTTMSHAATGKDIAGFAHRGRQFASVAKTLLTLAIARRRRLPNV